MSVHGGNLRAASRRYGRSEDAFLDFSANINPLGLPEPVADALRTAIGNVGAYPDPECVALREAIARLDGLEPDEVLCGNGASELLHIAFDAIRPAQTLLFAPGFADYERAARLSGSAVRVVPLDADSGWMPRPDELCDALASLSAGDVVITGQPNNPTSTLWNRGTLFALACACRDRGIYLLVDEAFIPLTIAGKSASLIDVRDQLPQTLLLRAFTKSLALPGVRLGYAIAAPALLQRLHERQITWSVNAFAQAIEPALAKLDAYAAATRSWLETELAAQYDAMRSIEGLTVHKPATNFILGRIETGIDAFALCDRMAKRGILVRNASNFHGLDKRYFRTAVKTRAENQVLNAALQASLCE